MSAAKNIRRHRRVAYKNPVRISWEEHNQPCFALTKGIDLSETGMRLESQQPLKPGERILLRTEKIQYSGSATVKYVVRYGCKHFVGLHLTHPIREKTIAEMEESAATPSI